MIHKKHFHRIKFINKSDNTDPKFQTEGSAGFDIIADLGYPIMLEAGQFKIIL